MSGLDPSSITVNPNGELSIGDPAAKSLVQIAQNDREDQNGTSRNDTNVRCINTTDCTGTNNRGCTNVHLCDISY
jgi:hypothetical protein